MTNFYLPEVLVCPVCGASLSREGGSLYCSGGRRHTYDIAKEGYVNLLPPGRAKNAKTGDGADMVRAREEFLAGGGYDRYSREAAEFAAGFLGGAALSGEAVPSDERCSGDGRSLTGTVSVVGDTSPTGEAVPKIEEGIQARGEYHRAVTVVGDTSPTGEVVPKIEILGVDASKYGVQTAAKRYVKNGYFDPRVEPCFVAGNIFHLPVADASADVFTSLFAPLPDDEVRRVLKPDGILLICAAGGDHLCEMRRVLYDNPVPSGGGATVPEGFEVAGETIIEYPLELTSHDEIMALFTMTPFYHNAPAEGRERLEALDSLTVTVQVKCTVGRRGKKSE